MQYVTHVNKKRYVDVLLYVKDGLHCVCRCIQACTNPLQKAFNSMHRLQCTDVSNITAQADI